MKSFELVPSDTSVKIKVFGTSIEDLFTNAAEALSATMVGGEPDELPDPEFSNHLEIKAVDHETLLVDWLMKLLELVSMEGIAIRDVKIEQLTNDSLIAEVYGSYVDRFDREISELLIDDLAIRELKDGFETTIVFKI